MPDSPLEVDIEKFKNQVALQTSKEHREEFIKQYLNWDITYLENLKTFESLPPKSEYPEITLPESLDEYHGKLKSLTLDALWLHPTIKSPPSSTSVYTPAVLALFGWKALPSSTTYSLQWTSTLREIPISILKTTPSPTQDPSEPKSLTVESILTEEKFILNPIEDHYDFSPARQNYKITLKKLAT